MQPVIGPLVRNRTKEFCWRMLGNDADNHCSPDPHARRVRGLRSAVPPRSAWLSRLKVKAPPAAGASIEEAAAPTAALAGCWRSPSRCAAISAISARRSTRSSSILTNLPSPVLPRTSALYSIFTARSFVRSTISLTFISVSFGAIPPFVPMTRRRRRLGKWRQVRNLRHLPPLLLRNNCHNSSTSAQANNAPCPLDQPYIALCQASLSSGRGHNGQSEVHRAN